MSECAARRVAVDLDQRYLQKLVFDLDRRVHGLEPGSEAYGAKSSDQAGAVARCLSPTEGHRYGLDRSCHCLWAARSGETFQTFSRIPEYSWRHA